MIAELSNYTSSRRLSQVFKALGDESRMRIFQSLRVRCGAGCQVDDAGAARTVSEIAREFDLALSTVSHHIKELRNAGLVRCERRAQRIHCSVNEDLLRELEEFFAPPES